MIVAFVTILPEFGINAGPLIAGIGLVGIAVGFGAQNVVRDLINGIEILAENQYGRGDFVRLRTTTGGTISGLVEDVNLRRTMLRDDDGAAQFVPHGAIEVASNLTRGESRVSFNVTVPYGADLDRVFSVIDAAGAALAADPAYAGLVLDTPRATGIDRLSDTTVEVRVRGSVAPGEQWRIASDLRRRLKLALDAAGIISRDSFPPS
jgi:small conductance mechanosensitive channel